MNGSLSFGAGLAIVVVVIVALSILPAIILLCVNHLASAGGSDFYIGHGLWNYFVLWVLIMVSAALK